MGQAVWKVFAYFEESNIRFVLPSVHTRHVSRTAEPKQSPWQSRLVPSPRQTPQAPGTLRLYGIASQPRQDVEYEEAPHTSHAPYTCKEETKKGSGKPVNVLKTKWEAHYDPDWFIDEADWCAAKQH